MSVDAAHKCTIESAIFATFGYTNFATQHDAICAAVESTIRTAHCLSIDATIFAAIGAA